MKLGYLLFGAAENVSKCLQAKDISVQEAHLRLISLPDFFEGRGQMSPLTSFMMVLSRVPLILKSAHLGYPAIEEHRPDLMMVALLTTLLHLEAIFA